MRMTHDDLTLNDVLTDPMILSVARADGITAGELKALLVTVSHRLSNGHSRFSERGDVSAAVEGQKRKLRDLIQPFTARAGQSCLAC